MPKKTTYLNQGTQKNTCQNFPNQNNPSIIPATSGVLPPPRSRWGSGQITKANRQRLIMLAIHKVTIDKE